MKIPAFLRPWSFLLWLVTVAVLLSSPAMASERFSLPSPSKVVRDVKGFIERVKTGVKGVSKQTWNAIREPFRDDEDEDEDDEVVVPRQRSAKPGNQATQNKSSFSRSKQAVPYRYDDGEKTGPAAQPERMGPPDEPLPKVNVTPGKTDAPDAGKPSTTPQSRRPFMTPEEKAPASSETADLPPANSSSRSDTPKATPPGVDPNLPFGRPVPGKRGLVYPPGATDSSENMVDVSDFKTGQIVRDPRTGKLFRVP